MDPEIKTPTLNVTSNVDPSENHCQCGRKLRRVTHAFLCVKCKMADLCFSCIFKKHPFCWEAYHIVDGMNRFLNRFDKWVEHTFEPNMQLITAKVNKQQSAMVSVSADAFLLFYVRVKYLQREEELKEFKEKITVSFRTLQDLCALVASHMDGQVKKFPIEEYISALRGFDELRKDFDELRKNFDEYLRISGNVVNQMSIDEMVNGLVAQHNQFANESKSDDASSSSSSNTGSTSSNDEGHASNEPSDATPRCRRFYSTRGSQWNQPKIGVAPKNLLNLMSNRSGDK